MPKNNWITPQIILTTYAAVISTFALGWNIVNALLDKASRIKIVAKMYIKAPLIDGFNIRLTVISLVIINLSKREKYIKEIGFKLPKKVTTWGKKSDTFTISILKDIEFPLAIAPEKEWSYNFLIAEGFKLLFDNFKEGRCKLIIKDTTGKKYTSKAIDIAQLYQAYQENVEVPRDSRFPVN